MNALTGPRRSVTLLVCSLSIGVLCWADDTPKPAARTSEEVILDKIAQLQRELDELRAAVAAERASAPLIPAVAATPAVPNSAAPPITAPTPTTGAADAAPPNKRTGPASACARVDDLPVAAANAQLQLAVDSAQTVDENEPPLTERE